VTRKPRHFAADRLRLAYSALTRLRDRGALSTEAHLEPYADDERGTIRAHRQDMDAALVELLDFVGGTGSREGLTAERGDAFEARTTLGVSVRLDGGSVVIRVPRRDT